MALVLAGGAAKRFGSDKLEAALDDRPLLHHAIEACAAMAPTIVLVLEPEAPPPLLPPSLGGRLLVAHDRVAHQGPLAGLAAGIEAASAAVADADVAVVVGGDMPTLVPDVLRLLVERLDEPLAPGTSRPDAVTLEAEPAATLPLAVRIAPAADEARTLLSTNRRSLRELLGQLRSTRVEAAIWRALDPEGLTISDIDTPDELAAARNRAP